MKENDVLRDLIGYKGILEAKVDLDASANAKIALCKVTKAIDEIQQYREIGTIEKLKTMSEEFWKLNEMCKTYSAIGTVEEIKEKLSLLEKYEELGTAEELDEVLNMIC